MAGKTLSFRGRGERIERAIAIRTLGLGIIEGKGQGQIVRGAPEIKTKMFEDDEFQMVFYMVPPVPIEVCEQFGVEPLHFGCYALEIWSRQVGKVLNLSWDSVGAPPRIVRFRRSEWEERFLRLFDQLR